MPEGGPYTLTIKGANTLTITGVYVGEVWQVAGQSNMDTRLSFYANLADSIKTANVPLLRYNTLRQPGQTSAGSNPWLVVSPSTAGDLSAIGYFFGREIQKTVGVAVGLIVTAVGGTTLASWQDPATLSANPSINDSDRGVMWNTWVAPVAGYGIRGTVWIQGEQDCNTASSPTYGDRFKLLIKGWRAAWGQGDFPFYFMSLSNIHGAQTDPNNASTVAVVREGQRLALALPNTEMGVSIDIGDANNWHYANKPEAGRRFSLIAKAKMYGQSSLVYSGPMYQSKTIYGSQIKMLFNTFGSAMVEKGGGALAGFAIAGATGNWVWATATVKGDTVIATSASVAVPTRVRYAWADNPTFNLFNTEGLPASPFTTESPAIPVTVRQGESLVARRGQTAGRITVGLMKPTKTISIDSDEEIQTIGVIDVSGRTWKTLKPGASCVIADLRGLNAGVYFFSIRTSCGRYVQKVSVWK
jgi:sialate O-acetylesterase